MKALLTTSAIIIEQQADYLIKQAESLKAQAKRVRDSINDNELDTAGSIAQMQLNDFALRGGLSNTALQNLIQLSVEMQKLK